MARILDKFSVGVIGGGISGSTVAIKLAEHGMNVQLFERSDSLVNGPPFCHLHAGGNLYREITEEQCVILLKECIETIKMYSYTMNIRPTVIAVPKHDRGEPVDLLPRLKRVQAAYKQLVQEDISNKLLGQPENYFKTFTKEQTKYLATLKNPIKPKTFDEWMIPVAKTIDIEKLKFPIVVVEEYGWSMFRTAASVHLATAELDNCNVHLQSKVIGLHEINGKQWLINYKKYNLDQDAYETKSVAVDYLINACGFQTGSIDDMVKLPCNRMTEFKAAYVSRWKECEGEWPEVIIHGQRGTPNGMAQLTPYPGNVFQLHGMTEKITLFENGLVKSTQRSAQPKFKEIFNKRLSTSWTKEEIDSRTIAAVNHIARFIPSFKTATCAGPPLFGAQQIPGLNPILRTAGVSFEGKRYARMEIVKASSAIPASENILQHITSQQSNYIRYFPTSEAVSFSSTTVSMNFLTDQFQSKYGLTPENVNKLSVYLAERRGYPKELAEPVGKLPLPENDDMVHTTMRLAKL